MFFLSLVVLLHASQVLLPGSDVDEISSEAVALRTAELRSLRLDPIDLRTAPAGRLRRELGLTPDQLRELLAARDSALVTLDQLASLDGWTPRVVEQLRPYVVFTAGGSGHEPRAQIELSTDLRYALEPVRGFRSTDSTRFLGPPLASTTRLDLRRGALQGGLTLDHDAGEPFRFSISERRFGADHLSGFLAYRREGLPLQAVLGSYALDIGAGALVGSSVPLLLAGTPARAAGGSLIRLRGRASSAEYNRLQGAAARLTAPGGLTAALWLNSSRHEPTSTERSLFQRIRRDGLHRTRREVDRPADLQLQGAGAAIGFERPTWRVGTAAVAERARLHDERESYAAGSLSALWSPGDHHLAAEFALRPGHADLQIGWSIAEGHQRLLLRFDHLGAEPASHLASTPRLFPVSTGESSLYGELTTVLTRRWRATLTARAGRARRGGDDPPAWQRHRSSYGLRLSGTVAPGLTTELLLSSKRRTSALPEAPVRDRGPLVRQVRRLDLEFEFSRHLFLLLRAESRYERRTLETGGHSLLAFTEFRYRPSPAFGLTGRLQTFSVPPDAPPVYAYERDLLYRFSVPAYGADGGRVYLLVQFGLGRTLTFRLKASATYFHTPQSRGSGSTFVSGQLFRDIRCQLMWRV